MMRTIQDSFFLRFVIAATTVFLTYNIQGFSYVHWIINNLGQLNLYMGLAAIVLVLAWLALIRASIASLSVIGFAATTIVFALVTGFSIHQLGLNANDKGAIIYIIELAIALTLSVGAPWSGIRHRFFAQTKTEKHAKTTKDDKTHATGSELKDPAPVQDTQATADQDTILLSDDSK